MVTIRILKNAGIQKTVNETAPFSMGSVDISGFEGQKFLNICWSYLQRISSPAAMECCGIDVPVQHLVMFPAICT